jgi:hypothetical protein
MIGSRMLMDRMASSMTRIGMLMDRTASSTNPIVSVVHQFRSQVSLKVILGLCISRSKVRVDFPTINNAHTKDSMVHMGGPVECAKLTFKLQTILLITVMLVDLATP